MEIVGIVLFGLGILVSVLLHEAGHMVTAKAFKMKVTRYFVGFGPTLWSFRKGETEYGVKALPLGGFVKIVGMTPQDDDVAPADEPRAMWRQPVWKRTIVMSAGSITHFALGFIILWGLFAFVAHADPVKTNAAAPVVDSVLPCVKVDWAVPSDASFRVASCDPVSDLAQVTAGAPDRTFARGLRRAYTAAGHDPVEPERWLLHELAHLIHPDHSPAFHALLTPFPDHERAQAYLEGAAYGQHHLRDVPPA